MLITNNYNLPPAFVQTVTSLIHDVSEADPKRIGVTTLINPPRMRILTARHWDSLTEDVSDHIWRISGSAIHHVLEQATHEDRLVEEKIEEEIDGITLVGKLDTYEKKIKSLEDWKFTSVFAVKLEEKEDWTNQMNCYAYFLEKAGYPVEQAHINAILKDWRRGESLKYSDYPPIPFVRKQIALWSKEEQEKYIKKRIKEYKIALELTDEELPECSLKDRWHKEDSFAIIKGNNKTATRVLDSYEEAQLYIDNIKDKKNTYTIQKREGEDFRCLNYCVCNQVCPFFKKRYGDKLCQNKNDFK